MALFIKLTMELENHYKEKLLSIADGSFDGHFTWVKEKPRMMLKATNDQTRKKKKNCYKM